MIWYFLLFFGMALAFYAGSYDYGADVRYSLATYPPVAILGGLGLARLVGRFERAGRGTLALAGLTAGGRGAVPLVSCRRCGRRQTARGPRGRMWIRRDRWCPTCEARPMF